MKPLSSTRLMVQMLAKALSREKLSGEKLSREQKRPIILPSHNFLSQALPLALPSALLLEGSHAKNNHVNVLSLERQGISVEAFSSAQSLRFQSLSSQSLRHRAARRCLRKSDSIMAILAVVGLGLGAPEAFAQAEDRTILRRPDGSVEIDSNAFDIRTGELDNESNIPLPTILPTDIIEGVAQPVTRQQEVPNSIEIRPDLPFIEQSFLEMSNQNGQDSDALDFDIRPETVEIQTQFDLRYRRGDHNFGEGIQVTVFGPNGEVKSQETVFVRGDAVTVGSDGELLPTADQIEATYGANDRVELRVLNIREDGAAPSESGIYFAEDGEFIVEDLPNGGDLDFDDGEYVRVPGGQGEAIAVEEQVETSTETREEITELPPGMRQEEVIESDIIQERDTVTTVREESREFGSVEYSTTTLPRVLLGHATGVRTPSGDQLVYDRYAAAGEARLGTDGLGATGQLRPLSSNPTAPPTLLTGNASFNPFVADNEAAVTTTVSLTQFLNPTHRVATDALGVELINPLDEGARLLEPIGLFNNRQMVGFVRDVSPETVMGEALVPVNGIFELPGGPVVIQPPNPEAVGRGNAAYTDNVGGLLLDNHDDSMVFIPQWTAAGYAQAPINLDGAETARVIYALVPQQAGQNLQLNERYEVTKGAAGHRITEGDFFIISADRQFQNFVQEMPAVYAVEDTVTGENAATTLFNGLQGLYAQEAGGERVPTVDVAEAAEADARVGNVIFPERVIAGIEGQQAYGQTSLAAGFYVNTSLTGGFGNQRDQVVLTRVTEDIEFDVVRSRQILNTFMVPQTRIDEVTLETSQTSEVQGTATFDISGEGLLSDVTFNPTAVISTSGPTTQEVNRDTRIESGEETLVEPVVLGESIERVGERVLARDEQRVAESDSYANFAPVRGEVLLGGVLNFGNTPWSAAANVVRAELFARDTVLGRGDSGGETGWRAEVVFHPFGEVREPAYRYDAAGQVVPIYQTEPVVNADGASEIEALQTAEGDTVELPVNQFVFDEAGERVPQMVGTGKADGPGAYIRFEDVIDDGESVVIAGGIQFSF